MRAADGRIARTKPTSADVELLSLGLLLSFENTPAVILYYTKPTFFGISEDNFFVENVYRMTCRMT